MKLIEIDSIVYIKAIGEIIKKPESSSSLLIEKIQSAPTTRTEGGVKLRISPCEIVDPHHIKSTRS